MNLHDDRPTLMFGPRLENLIEDDVPPCYISLNIHDMYLHNPMIDSGASHNFMPKEIMKNLGLYITRAYKYMYSFDSKKVKSIGLIKDLVVSLQHIPEKSMVIDVVMADVLVRFGMLLSRSWSTKINDTMKMDLSYATILIFGE